MAQSSIEDFDINSISPDFIENPYPILSKLQQHAPLHFNPDGSAFVTRHDDIRAIYQTRTMISDKTEALGEKFGDTPLNEHHTTSLVFNDPPYHTTVRKLLSAAFTPRKLGEMENLIETSVDKLLDQIDHGEPIEFVSDFAMKLPTTIISVMLGIPDSERHRMRGFSLAILGALDPVVSKERLDEGNKAVTEFSEMLTDIIAHRRQNPDNAGPGEVLDALIFGEADGVSLNQEELIQNCIFLLNAGHETTTSLLSNAVEILFRFPEQHNALKQDIALVDQAIEETLRYESPLQIGNRLATEDFEISGGLIPKGTYVHTSIAAANRDPNVFANPQTVDFSRQQNRHLAFITGIHVCLGATLARLEGRIALKKLVVRFPNLRQADEPKRLPLARFRGFHELPVLTR